VCRRIVRPAILILIGGVAVSVITRCLRHGRLARLAIAAVFVTLFFGAPAMAQAPAADDPNPGAITFTGGLDFPSVYFFRGLRQEGDPGLTMFPYGDIGIAFYSGNGGVKSAGVNFGVWNSLQTGSTGSDGPSGKLHYEEDFYATLSLGFGAGMSLTTGYMALTSPNNMFNTVKEWQVKVSKAGMLAPYGFLAFELSDKGQADAGTSKGTYLELGVGPTFPIGKAGPTLTIPVKFGLSLGDYYELGTEDNKYGFFDLGALVTVPIKKIPSKFGSWNIHGGLDWLNLGDTTAAFNPGDDGQPRSNQVIGLFGIGLTY